MPAVTRTQNVNADSWYITASGSNFGNGKGDRMGVGRMYASSVDWQTRFGIRIPRGTLFDGVLSADAITAFDLWFRVANAGDCDDIGSAVRFFLERGTTALSENSENGRCVGSTGGASPAARWPGPTRTATDRAFYSGAPNNGQWIRVNALALGKWWYANQTVTELVLVAIAANNAGTDHEENTQSRRLLVHTTQSSGNAPYAQLVFDNNTAPNAPTDLSPADGSTIASTNGTSATVSGRHTDPDGDASTAYQAQWWPSAATDDEAGNVSGATVTKDQTVTTTTANNGLRSHSFTSLPARTAGKWRMRFKDASLWGAWSRLRAATTAYQPAAPTQPSVTPGTLTPDFSASISSSDSSDYITAAEVIVYQDPAQGQTITKWASGKQAIGGTSNRYVLTYQGTALTYSQQYRWITRIWNRDDVASEFTGNLYFRQVEAVGPTIQIRVGSTNYPADLSTKIDTRTPTIRVSDPGLNNINQAQVRLYSPSGTLLHDFGLESFTSAAHRDFVVPSGVWDWGQEPLVDARIRVTGNADPGPYTEQRRIHLNAAPGSPYPLSVSTAGAVVRSDGVVVVDAATPTVVAPFRDLDLDLGYTEAPTRSEFEVRTLADAYFGASPYIDSSAPIATSLTLPTLTAETTYKVRANFDDSAAVRSAWSEYLYVKRSTKPELTLVSPANGSTITAPRPTIIYSYNSAGGKAQAYRRIRASIGGAEIYNTGSVATVATTHRLPAGVLTQTGVTVDFEVESTDTDGLTATLTFSVTTNFTEPPALTGLTLTPDPDSASMVIEWDASGLSNDEFSSYLVGYRVGGDWVEIADIEDKASTRYRFKGVPHNINVQVRVRQDNGFLTSAAVIESEMVERRGYVRVGSDGVDDIRYVRIGGHSGEPSTTTEVSEPPFGGTIVSTWGSHGYRGQFQVFMPPDSDVLSAFRDDMRLGRSVWLKFPKGDARLVRVTAVPDTDREVGYRDIGVTYVSITPTDADYGAVEA
jgi:hypothetical protein